MNNNPLRIEDDLDKLLEILPSDILNSIKKLDDLKDLIEVILDVGRRPEARFPGNFVYLSEKVVTKEDIAYVAGRIGAFGKDNRAGIGGTLHRISAIRNRQGEIMGLTCRVGRAVYGVLDIISDIIKTGKSILLLGRPGVGKTTLLREAARILADDLLKRVIVVDTSNEIAGDGDIPHRGIGNSRRMQVAEPALQYAVMIEAVENHMPEVIVIDEIGTEQEAYAARTIAERGVQLIATAHGNTLDNLLMNPTLSDLIGGIQAVTLSDEEARKRGTQKTVLERKAPPTFDIIIEIQDKDTLVIHDEIPMVIDLMLRGNLPQPEIRVRKATGEIDVIQSSNLEELAASSDLSKVSASERIPQIGLGAFSEKVVKIYPCAVSRNKLERAILDLRVSARIVRKLEEADIVLTLKGFERREAKRMKKISEQMPVFSLRSNTITQVKNFLKDYFHLPSADTQTRALKEADIAAQEVLHTSKAKELAPQSPYIRRLQHQLVSRYNLKTKSVGTEQSRHLTVYKE